MVDKGRLDVLVPGQKPVGDHPVKGDAVLFYGEPLVVTSVEQNHQDKTIIRLYDRRFHVKRANAEHEMKTLMRLYPSPEREFRIMQLAPVLNGNATHVTVMADTLRYWPEKGVWVSEGRVLKDAQKPNVSNLRDQGFLKGAPVSI
jgi:hypothetical protein